MTTFARVRWGALVAIGLWAMGCGTSRTDEPDAQQAADADQQSMPDQPDVLPSGDVDTINEQNSPETTTCPATACIVGQQRCQSDLLGTERCEDSDGDGCGRWTAAPCDAGETCDAQTLQCVLEGCAPGSCSNFAEHWCATDGTRIEGCQDPDGDGCGVIGELTNCAPAACEDGQCAGLCADPPACLSGQSECTEDGSAVRNCGVDNNGCAAWQEQTCPTGQTCILNECHSVSLEVVALPTDILVVTQQIPVQAQLVSIAGTQPIDPTEVTWDQSADAVGLLDFVTEGNTTHVRGLAYGGGGQFAPDGTVSVQAHYAGLDSEPVAIQVVELRQGTGVYPQGPTPQTEDPDAGIPQAPGPARYDGIYNLHATRWYCNETTTCPAGGTCNLRRHACVNSSGAEVAVLSNCEWNEQPCAPHAADIRLFLGERSQLGLLANATYAQFAYDVLIYEPPTDWAGPFDPPEVPRPLYIEWEIFPGERTDVVQIDPASGGITAIGTGRTAVTGWLGLQGVTFEVVVYDQFGYVPSEDYGPGVTPENGHLVLFSSSNGPAAAGTHDTVRVLDLNNYQEQDRRPSKYGPQGLRLRENGNELYGGGGCGMIKTGGDEVFLLNGRFAISLNTHTVTQGRNFHQVNFAPAGDWSDGTARSVCQGAYWKDPDTQTEWLFGAEMSPATLTPTRLWYANITNLAGADVTAQAFDQEPALVGKDTWFFSPTVYTDKEGLSWLLGIEPGMDTDGVQSEFDNLHFIGLSVDSGELEARFDVNDSLAGDLPPANLQDGWIGHPGLTVARFHDGRDMAFVGNDTSITVVDLDNHDVVSYADVNPHGGAGLESRWYGYTIKDFALSPDGNKLYAVPYESLPQYPLYCDTAAQCSYVPGQAWTCNSSHQCVDHHGDVVYPNQQVVDYRSVAGAIQSTELSAQRAAVIDLSATAGTRPMFDESLWECLRDDDIQGTDFCAALPHRRLGIDLRFNAFKKHFLDQNMTGSAGAIPAVLALNIRQMEVSQNALFLIGADYSDGAGSALANLTDLAVYKRTPGPDGHTARGVVFRGYHGDGYGLVGLSDAFGFRLGDRDAVLGQNRVKNVGIIYLPGSPPADNPGNGPAILDDEPLPDSDNYADAPDLPTNDEGSLLLLASAPDSVMGVMRTIELGDYSETDLDSATVGAQGVQLMEDNSAAWGGCGMVRGRDNEVWIFTGTTALAFDAQTHTQKYGNHYVSWPGSSDIRFCNGAYWQSADGAHKLLFAVDSQPEQPDVALAVADLSGLADGNVDAAAVEDPYLEPYMAGTDQVRPRYVQAEILGNDLMLLEKNEPRTLYRNVVHRAAIQPTDGSLTFDPARDLQGEYTSEPLYQWGDPGMFIADFNGAPHLFIGNQNTISVYDLANPANPQRLNYNADGDSIQDDLDMTWFGRSICAFTTSPDGSRLFALPYVKSGRMPVDTVLVPLGGGNTRTQGVDRFRIAAIDLTNAASGRPEPDPTINHGNGIDIVYRYLKQQIVADGVSPGMIPPLFYTLRRQLAASQRSVFILGFDAYDGAGSALSLVNDVGVFNIATGQGYILSDVAEVGYPDSTTAWGLQLGVDSNGLKEEDMPRGKVAGALYLP